MSPSSLRDEGAAPPRAGFLLFPFWGSSPPPSRDVRLQVRLPAQRSAAPLTGHMRPSAPHPSGPGLGARWTSSRTRGLREFFFLKQKASAARRPLLPGPRHLPFTPTPHLPGTRAARCLSRQTMGSGPTRQAASPEPPAPSRDAEKAERGGLGGGRRGGGGGHNGRGGSLPLGTGGSLPAPGKGEGAGVSCTAWSEPRGPAPGRRRALTSTMANRSSSSPGSGIGSFKGTLCALKSVCCESMLPALPMLAAHRGQGLLRAPCVRVGNQNSSRRPASSAGATCPAPRPPLRPGECAARAAL